MSTPVHRALAWHMANGGPCTIVAKCVEDLYLGTYICMCDELCVSGPESLDRLPRAAVDVPFDETTGLHHVLRFRIRHDSRVESSEDSLRGHRKSPRRLDASSGRRNQVLACPHEGIKSVSALRDRKSGRQRFFRLPYTQGLDE